MRCQQPVARSLVVDPGTCKVSVAKGLPPTVLICLPFLR